MDTITPDELLAALLDRPNRAITATLPLGVKAAVELPAVPEGTWVVDGIITPPGRLKLTHSGRWLVCWKWGAQIKFGHEVEVNHRRPRLPECGKEDVVVEQVGDGALPIYDKDAPKTMAHIDAELVDTYVHDIAQYIAIAVGEIEDISETPPGFEEIPVGELTDDLVLTRLKRLKDRAMLAAGKTPLKWEK